MANEKEKKIIRFVVYLGQLFCPIKFNNFYHIYNYGETLSNKSKDFEFLLLQRLGCIKSFECFNHFNTIQILKHILK